MRRSVPCKSSPAIPDRPLMARSVVATSSIRSPISRRRGNGLDTGPKLILRKGFGGRWSGIGDESQQRLTASSSRLVALHARRSELRPYDGDCPLALRWLSTARFRPWVELGHDAFLDGGFPRLAGSKCSGMHPRRSSHGRGGGTGAAASSHSPEQIEGRRAYRRLRSEWKRAVPARIATR